MLRNIANSTGLHKSGAGEEASNNSAGLQLQAGFLKVRLPKSIRCSAMVSTLLLVLSLATLWSVPGP
jgi:hypothetical protein